MIDSTFVKAITDLAAPTVHTDAAGNSFSDKPLHNLPPLPHYAFPFLRLETLDGLVSYVKENRDSAVAPASCQILCGARLVSLVTAPKGEQLKRDCLVEVRCPTPEYRSSADYHDLETFRINLLTQYEDSPSRGEILKFISSVKDEAVRESRDDGVSQSVAARAGIASMALVQVPSPVTLAPKRTFPEIIQPPSDFIFRMRRDEKAGMLAGLFYIADGWQSIAAQAVAQYLKQDISGFTILA